jgi:hypothetical protein
MSSPLRPLTLSAPFNAVRFFLSPGKGLLWYSPLVVLGSAGLFTLRRRDRQLALTLVVVVALGVAAVAVTPYWTDETWGPRYLLPVAWLLLVPIPWWATKRSRRRILGAVATIAVAVQLIGVIVPTAPVVDSAEALTGATLYQQRGPGQVADAPFGHDSLAVDSAAVATSDPDQRRRVRSVAVGGRLADPAALRALRGS